jgi:hypothetical protein
MKKRILKICTLLIVVIILLVPGQLCIKKTTTENLCCGRQNDCTMIITDNFKTIDINNSKDVVWQYQIGSSDSERLANGNTLRSGGIIVKEVNSIGSIVWQYSGGLLGVADVERLGNDHTLITDMIRNFVIEVNYSGAILWQYDTGLSLPVDAERLSNGNTLIVLNLIGAVIEVNSTGHTVWEYSTGLSFPTDAERLLNGNTLITDYNNNRVIEVNTTGDIIWQKTGLLKPKDAERLSNGNTIIVEYDNNSVIEVDSSGVKVWNYSRGLNGPSDAEVPPNIAPTTPVITGPPIRLVNINQYYHFTCDDPYGHTIYYWIDWGDGNNTGWIGPYVSGSTVSIAHKWISQDTYIIKAKAIDVCEMESSWGELELHMPSNIANNRPFLNFLQNHPNMFPMIQRLLHRLGIL